LAAHSVILLHTVMTIAKINQRLIISIGIAVATLVFFFDIHTPLGIAMGIPYLSLVILTLWLKDARYVLLAALLGIVLTVLGAAFLKPMPTTLSMAFVITNRLLVIATIIFTALLIFQYKKAESKVKEQQLELNLLNENLRSSNKELEQKVRHRTQILEESLGKLEKTTAELNSSLEKEKELNELKSRFVSMASHEFRTPLATILSSLVLAKKYGEQNEKEKQHRHFQRIENSVHNLTEIINDVLSVSKLEEGKIRIEYEMINVPMLITTLVNEMKTIAKEGQSIDYRHSGKDVILLDSKALRLILTNLVSNAIKFSPPGSPVLITSEISDHELKLTVRDHGIGISPADQQHLFERFFRGENVTSIQGTGLGLNIVAKFVELLGGQIEFSSTLDAGSEFHVLLPALYESPVTAGVDK
jgi:signal transduction histidine kinase